MAKKYLDVRRALRDNDLRHLRTNGSDEVWEHPDDAEFCSPAPARTTARFPATEGNPRADRHRGTAMNTRRAPRPALRL